MTKLFTVSALITWFPTNNLRVHHEKMPFVINDLWHFLCQSTRIKGTAYTLKTGIPVEDADPMLKLLRGVYHPKIQLGVGIHSKLQHHKNLKKPLHLSRTRVRIALQSRSKSHIFSIEMEKASSTISNFWECIHLELSLPCDRRNLVTRCPV